MKKGITKYSHLNEAAKLIYYIVFITVEREVLYVLYALCHNEIITSDAHSTDTHEYTEALPLLPVFGDRIPAKACFHSPNASLFY